MDNLRDHLERCYKNFVIAESCNGYGTFADCLCVACMAEYDKFTLSDSEMKELLENLGL